MSEMKRIDQYMIVAANLKGPCNYNRNTWQEAEKIWMSGIKELALKLMSEADKLEKL